MSKTGRNDPCPCGSGRKYKKCCLPKEQQRSTDARARERTDDLFEKLEEDPSEHWVEEESVEEGGPSESRFYDEPFESKTISEETPAISAEGSAIVDAWWKAYLGMKDPDSILRHLDAFFQAHPDLVTNLELHDDVLFELETQLVKVGRGSDYIDLLRRIRVDFPDAYLKNFAFFDLDIIRYKVAAGHDPEGIEEYLNWFKEYPDSNPDHLFALVDFLMATECDQALVDLLEVTCYPVCRSPNVIGGGELLAPLVFSYQVPFLNQGWSEADLDSLVERMRAIRVPLNDELYRSGYHVQLFDEVLGELDEAFFSTFHDGLDIPDFYRAVTRNFMGWLHEEKQLSWMKALFYRSLVNQYLLSIIPNGKRPKQPFIFSKRLIDGAVIQMAQKMLSLDATTVLGALNAIYWFAEYLHGRQAIPEEVCVEVQGWCEALREVAMPQFLGSAIEAPAFETFPG